MSSFWTIAYGDYELIVDRRALIYRLTETKTNTVWAENFSLGWVELENRETGEITRHDFGSLRCVSVSEKSGPQGKRILFGLDIHGVPIDLYLICSQREIQLQIEANRDSKTHNIAAFGLTPGLCAVPDDGQSYLLAPEGSGRMWLASFIQRLPLSLRVWDNLTMPFVGAVRHKESGNSALCTITDSAYAVFTASRWKSDDNAAFDLRYDRDPERRRLDLRILCLPYGDGVAIAHAYREKLIADNNHVTLRKKMRERPALEKIIGTPHFDVVEVKSRDGKRNRNDSGKKHLQKIYHGAKQTQAVADILRFQEGESPQRLPVADLCDAARKLGYWSALSLPEIFQQRPNVDFTQILHENHADSITDWTLTSPFQENDRWKEMENRLQLIGEAKAASPLLGAGILNDWAAFELDYTRGIVHEQQVERQHASLGRRFPVQAVVYHDCVVLHALLYTSPLFLQALLNLNAPRYPFSTFAFDFDKPSTLSFIERTSAVLCPLHRLTFSAFLTHHRFLSADGLVEEAVYSDKTRVVINQSETEIYETEEFALPPLGFYVRHSQMEAHDALRIGDETFATRAWRTRRSRDGKLLEESGDVERWEWAA